MNKAKLIEEIAKKTSLTRVDTEKTVEAFTSVVAENIKQGETVKLVGFGQFSVSHRKARMGRNPQTGKEIEISARDVAVFKAGKELKSILNS